MPSTDRATNWSVTINMKNVSQQTAEDCINQARQRGWIVNGQMEQGEEGTEHYQLHVKTPQTRFSAVKQMFPTAHIEVARNVKALALYVKKEATRVAELPEHDEKYITTSRLWDMIYEEFNTASNDGWDLTNDDDVRFYRDDVELRLSNDPLAFFDKVMGRFIRRGFYVDMLVINPGVRAFWKKFYKDVLFRSRATLDRQTDRQDEILSQHVSIPTNASQGDTSPGSEDSPCEDSNDFQESGGSSDEGYSEGSGSDASEADTGSED